MPHRIPFIAPPLRSLRPLTIAIALALFLAAAPCALGQQSGPVGGRAGIPAPGGAASQPAIADDPRFSIDFPGGTINEYVVLLRELVDDANIVVLGDAGQYWLPAFSLRNVDVFIATALLNRQLHHHHEIRSGANPATIPMVEVNTISPSRQAGQPARPMVLPSPIVTISTKPVAGREAPSEPKESKFTVVSIGPLLHRGLSAADILDAVETALTAADEAGEGATLAYHEPTQLVMVTAPLRVHGIIGETLSALRDSRPPKNAEALSAELMQEQVELLKAEIRLLQQENETLSRQVGEASALQQRMIELELELRERRRVPGGGAGGAGGSGEGGRGGASGAPDGRGGAGSPGAPGAPGSGGTNR